MNTTRPAVLEGGSTAPHVLIVDDDDDSRELYSTFLSQMGCRVTEAATGASALAAVERSAPDVVVLDLWLSDIDGLEICPRLKGRAEGSTTPVIVVTGVLLKPSDAARLTAAGADLLLLKPCDPSTLLDRVREVLAKSSGLATDAAV